MSYRNPPGGFDSDTLARHLRVSKATLALFVKAAGVVRRVRYIAAETRPVYHKFTQTETEAILRAAWAHKGRRHARGMGIL